MTVGPRTRAALQALGYEVKKLAVTQRDPYGGSHRIQTVGHVFGVVRSLNDEEQEVVLQPLGIEKKETEENGWDVALDHLKANAEALCSRMMAAYMRWTEEAGITSRADPDGSISYFAMGERFGEPHDAVLALFLKVCCDGGDAP